VPFSTEKLEWLGYPKVKKIEVKFIRFDTTHERDRHTDTDRHHMTAKAALDASIARQKWK